MTSKSIGKLIRKVAHQMMRKYPSVEFDDLESQGWLIVTEQIGEYDKSRGASMSTFLYSRLRGHLSMYIKRKLLKELNMNGLRDHSEYHEVSIPSCEDRVEARIQIEEMVEASSGVAKDVLLLMLKGYNQSEVAEHLGISRQRVAKILQGVRERYS